MPLGACNAREVSCSIGHTAFDEILISALLLYGLVLAAVTVATVYEVRGIYR